MNLPEFGMRHSKMGDGVFPLVTEPRREYSLRVRPRASRLPPTLAINPTPAIAQPPPSASAHPSSSVAAIPPQAVPANVGGNFAMKPFRLPYSPALFGRRSRFEANLLLIFRHQVQVCVVTGLAGITNHLGNDFK